MERAVILSNIRSAHNVGSVFRTADAAGVSMVLLVGYTPQPIDKFGRIQKDIAKTALGAERTVLWKHYKTLGAAVRVLKKQHWRIVGVELDAAAVDYRDFALAHNTAFVMGNEVEGLSAREKALCDALVEIPMHGSKESLNVSVAAGIILFSQTPKKSQWKFQGKSQR